MIDALEQLTALVLGLFAGSLLTEGFLLVPYWRTLKTDAFYDLHDTFGPRLFQYFAPLTAVATALAIINPAVNASATNKIEPASLATAGLILLVTAFYPLYFQRANQSLADKAWPENRLKIELANWARMHMARTFLALLAFGTSILAVAAP